MTKSKFFDKFNGTICLDTLYVQQSVLYNDVLIMDLVISDNKQSNRNTKKRINWLKMYLDAQYTSKISTSKGNKLVNIFLEGNHYQINNYITTLIKPD